MLTEVLGWTATVACANHDIPNCLTHSLDEVFDSTGAPKRETFKNLFKTDLVENPHLAEERAVEVAEVNVRTIF